MIPDVGREPSSPLGEGLSASRRIVTHMLARTQHGIDLRQMTPFAGVLTDTERRRAPRSVTTAA